MIVGFLFFIALNIAIGWWAWLRGTSSRDDYLLAGRTLGPLAVGVSAAATANSGFIMLGAVGLGYSLGTTWLFLPLGWFLGDLLFWKLFPARMKRLSAESNISTVPELLVPSGSSGWRVGRPVLALLICAVLVTYGASQVLAGSKTLGALFGLSHVLGGFATVSLVGIYGLFGGFRASVWTDLLQGLFMVLATAGMLAMATAGVMEADNFAYLRDSSPGHLIPFAGMGFTPVVGFILGWACAALGFGLSQPQVVARYFAAKDETSVKKAKWIYLSFLQFTWAGMTLFGVFARALVRDLADPELALLAYAEVSLPPLIAGLVLAGVFAAIASTLDSLILAVSGMVSGDLAPAARIAPAARGRALEVAAAVATLAAVLGIAVASSKNVFQLSVLPVELVAGSVGPAVAIRIFYGVRGTLETLLITFLGAAGVLAWRAAGLESFMSSAAVGLLVFLSAIAVRAVARSRKSTPLRD